MNQHGIVVVLSGPSGSGKSSIYRKAFDVLPGFEFSVSCTTRAPREGEIDGKDYRFVSPEQFEELVRQGAFVEFAEVHGNRYGTLKSELLDRTARGADVLLDIDVQGAAQIRDLCKRDPQLAKLCLFLFVAPPSLQVLEERLRGRGSETEESLRRRLSNASKEMARAGEYDETIVNDELDRAADAFVQAIRRKKESLT